MAGRRGREGLASLLRGCSDGEADCGGASQMGWVTGGNGLVWVLVGVCYPKFHGSPSWVATQAQARLRIDGWDPSIVVYCVRSCDEAKTQCIGSNLRCAMQTTHRAGLASELTQASSTKRNGEPSHDQLPAWTWWTKHSQDSPLPMQFLGWPVSVGPLWVHLPGGAAVSRLF